jgi:hypothetical protein
MVNYLKAVHKRVVLRAREGPDVGYKKKLDFFGKMQI